MTDIFLRSTRVAPWRSWSYLLALWSKSKPMLDLFSQVEKASCCAMRRRHLTLRCRLLAVQMWILPLVCSTLPSSSASRVSLPNKRTLTLSSRQQKDTILSIRGGSNVYDAAVIGSVPRAPYDGERQQSFDYANDPRQQSLPQQSYQSVDSGDPNLFEPPVTASANDPVHETVQERLDQWRSVQMANSAQSQASLHDDQGRMKLLTSIGKGSRAAIFFILMWRDVSLYETASARSNLSRMVLSVPLIFLFIGNMAGAIVSLTSPSHATKKRLKAILNLDKLVEVFLLVYYVIRLTVWPSRYTPREVYIGNCFHSAFFLLQCQGCTRLSWDENAAQPVSSYTRDARLVGNNVAPQATQYPATPPRVPERLGDDEWN
jgi:hypothetical protein